MVEKHFYMSKRIKNGRIHIVEAGTETEAIEKIMKHYESKNEEYSVYYNVYIDYCTEVIK